jgi:hypothetical protein
MHRRRVVGDRITYVGLDVHKEGIVVAVAEGGIRGEVRAYGRIGNTAGALDRLTRKLGGEGVGLRFCYEAGPCGYGIQRHLSAHGHDCIEIAWKAQLRLCARYRKLTRSGKPANVVTAAIARELAGFIWAIARRVPPAAG